jgi:ankyrin repeat protein
VIKILLAQKAHTNIKERINNDNLLHLNARLCNNFEILEYLVTNLNQDMLFERNKLGETPLTICEQSKNSKGVELLEKLQYRYDFTRQKAGDLLA